MTWENWFTAANSIALAGWLALILMPRHALLLSLLRYILPGLLATAYTLLVLVYVFHVEGGGFNSLAEVKALLGTEPTLLAGWVHYLAFDLFVGTWIAERADLLGVSRLLQAPILVLTFLFGPIGYLTFVTVETALKSASAAQEVAP